MISGIRRAAVSVAAVSVAGAGMFMAAGSGTASAAATPGYIRTGLWGPAYGGPVRSPNVQGGLPARGNQPGAVTWKPSGPDSLSVQRWL